MAQPDIPAEMAPSVEDGKVDKPSSILFLCNHNVIRSPMAERLMRNDYGLDYYVQSAGINNTTTDPFVTAVMAELDIDIANHVPKALENLDDTWFDLIITFSPTAHHKALLMEHIEATEIVYWPAADPTVVQGSRDQMLDAYRDVRNAIRKQLVERFGPPRVQPAK